MSVITPEPGITLRYQLPPGITAGQAARLDTAIEQQLKTLLSFLPTTPDTALPPMPELLPIGAAQPVQEPAEEPHRCGAQARNGLCRRPTPPGQLCSYHQPSGNAAETADYRPDTPATPETEDLSQEWQSDTQQGNPPTPEHNPIAPRS